jgi:hypothetical protein
MQHYCNPLMLGHKTETKCEQCFGFVLCQLSPTPNTLTICIEGGPYLAKQLDCLVGVPKVVGLRPSSGSTLPLCSGLLLTEFPIVVDCLLYNQMSAVLSR